MVAWLVLIGIVLIPTAGFLLWSWRSSRNDMALMRATETTRAADVATPGGKPGRGQGQAPLRRPGDRRVVAESMRPFRSHHRA
jgi:hypothetical protein